jgi:gamma-glutamyltranspeptidase
MTKSGILMNNAMANFAIPGESGELNTANQLVKGRRPLTSNVVALTMDTNDICGKRIATGGATASSVGQVRI